MESTKVGAIYNRPLAVPMGVRKNKCFPLTEKRGADIIMSIQMQGNGVRMRRRCPAFFREEGELMNDLIRHAQQINQQLAR